MVPSGNDDELVIEPREGHELWRLNRPSRRNALSLSLLSRIEAERAAAPSRGVTVVVLAGAEVSPGTPAFCAGSDLGDLQRLGGEAGLSGELPRSPLHESLARLLPLPFTLITAINGAAIGGGVELALLGDVRVARPDAHFLLPPSKLGIVYPADGLSRLRASLGESLLRAMLVTAKGVSAERLFQAGVLWSLAHDCVGEASRLAAEIARLPAEARLANARACAAR